MTIPYNLHIIKWVRIILTLKGGFHMIVTATEFKTNLGKYLELAALQDIFITKNGKSIARVTGPQVNRLELLDDLVGVIPESATDANTAREERLGRQ